MVSTSTQEFVPIREIRNGIIILKDGSLRLVLMASSHNLALKSEDEQEAILSQFQNTLNSLDFSIQFFVQSRKLDIRPYISLLQEREKEQTSDLMRLQVGEYIEFIKSFSETVNIMTKTFFIVIPYSPSVLGKAGGDLISRFTGRTRQEGKEAHLESFEENRTQLEQRASVVEQGLASTGIRVARLGTEELIELFFKMFNPGEVEKPIPSEKAAKI
ncbi:MAG: hypothetical protein HY455_00460 [Parcubacteria group bacterium]|nr:hypothetical protein [Parcubacteria group bacterium]